MQDRSRPACISWERLAPCRALDSDQLCSPHGIHTHKVPRPSHRSLCIIWEGREKKPLLGQVVETLSQAKAGCCTRWRDKQWEVSCNSSSQARGVQHSLGGATWCAIGCLLCTCYTKEVVFKEIYGVDCGRRGRGWAITEEKLGSNLKHPRSSVQLEVGVVPPVTPQCTLGRFYFFAPNFFIWISALWPPQGLPRAPIHSPCFPYTCWKVQRGCRRGAKWQAQFSSPHAGDDIFTCSGCRSPQLQGTVGYWSHNNGKTSYLPLPAKLSCLWWLVTKANNIWQASVQCWLFR